MTRTLPVLSLGPDGSPEIEVVNIASALVEADRYAFRQGTNGTGTEVVDDVMIATAWAEVVPEPATLALLAPGMCQLLRRRR